MIMSSPTPIALFMVQRSEELSLPFTSAQHGTQQFSLHCRHRYAFEVSPPSPRLSESSIPHIAPYPDALTAFMR